MTTESEEMRRVMGDENDGVRAIALAQAMAIYLRSFRPAEIGTALTEAVACWLCYFEDPAHRRMVMRTFIRSLTLMVDTNDD
jgi:hypothetical protein